MFFEITSDFEGLCGDTSIQNPPTYVFDGLILHNMTQNHLDIKQGSIIGKFKIQNLQQKYTYLPEPIDEDSFNKYTHHTSKLADCNYRFQLSEKIANLINIRNNKNQNGEIANLHENTQRQIFITKLVKKAKVNPASLPRGKGDKLSLNFNDLLSRLNTVLVGQYLQNLTSN